jgi:hypothetical protein
MIPQHHERPSLRNIERIGCDFGSPSSPVIEWHRLAAAITARGQSALAVRVREFPT